MGLEPTRPYEHRHLKPACLPIPARSQIVSLSIVPAYYTRPPIFVKSKISCAYIWDRTCPMGPPMTRSAPMSAPTVPLLMTTSLWPR